MNFAVKVQTRDVLSTIVQDGKFPASYESSVNVVGCRNFGGPSRRCQNRLKILLLLNHQ